MSTYPGAVDSFPDREDGDPIPATDHDNLASAVVAIETELGTNPSGSAATVAQRLTTIEGSLGGGGAVSSVVGQTGAVTGSQILADSTVTAALAAKADASATTSALAGKAATAHTHVQGDVTGLTAALAAKLDTSAAASTYAATTPGNKLRRAAQRAASRNPLDLGVMASPPTVTVGTTRADGTLTNLYTAAGDAAIGQVTHLGGTPLNYTNVYWRYPVATRASGGNVSATQDATSWGVEFYTDSPSVEMLVLNTNLTTGFMVYVNDQPISASAVAYAATTGGSYVLLAFGSSAVRKIRYEADQAGGFGRVYVKPTSSIWPTVGGDEFLRAAWVGDSFGVGTGATLAAGAWPFRVAKMLGWSDIWSVSFGGTGFANAGAVGVKYGATSRVAGVVAANPTVVVLNGSTNDDGQATLQADVTATLQAYRAALPLVPLVVVGPSATSTGPGVSRLANEAAVQAGVSAAADSNAFFIPNSSDATGSWMSGTGKSGATTGTGNSDVYTSTDGTHPTQAGYDFLARRFAQSFRQIVLPTVG